MSTMANGAGGSKHVLQGETLQQVIWDVVYEIRDIVYHVFPDAPRLKRQETAFYRFVKEADVRVVSESVRYMKENDMRRELAWVFGKDDTSRHRDGSRHGHHVKHALGFLLVATAAVLLSPVFYLVHVVAYSLYRKFRRNKVCDIKLPLVYAIMSESADMIHLFMTNGCSISDQDDQGNNVFHYLGDLSAFKRAAVTRSMEIFLDVYRDQRIIKKCLMKVRNAERLSALEDMARYGSIQFFTNVAFTCCETQIKTLDAFADYHYAPKECDDADSVKLELQSQPTTGRRCLHLHRHSAMDEVDTAIYEQEDSFGLNSYLLQIIAGHKAEDLSRRDIIALTQTTLISKALRKKTHAYTALLLLWQAFCVLVTLMILYEARFSDLASYKGPAFEDLLNRVIPSMEQYAAMNDTINVTDSGDHIYTLKTAFVDMFAGCRESHSGNAPEQILTLVSDVIVPTESDGWSYVVRVNLITCMLANLALDLVTRFIFLCYNYNFQARSISLAVLPMLGRLVPGSYSEMQMSVTVSVLYLLILVIHGQQVATLEQVVANYNWTLDVYQPEHPMYYRSLLEKVVSPLLTVLRMNTTVYVLLLLCILMRFLHTGHIFRLVPVIGFFVIAAKKMCRHMLQFFALFLLATLCFAAVFHMIMLNSECPLHASSEFSALTQSFFSVTHQLAAGPDEAGGGGVRIPSVMAANVLFTLVMCVMMANLVIAIMTTTANALKVWPWSEMVYNLELWNETLGLEARFLAITYPARCLYRRYVSGHRHNAHIVHRTLSDMRNAARDAAAV